MLADLIRDLRLAVRGSLKTPLLTLVILLTLAVGIGATSAIFSVVNGVMQPLSYPEPDELVLVSTQFPSLGFDRFWMSPPEYLELEEWNQSFESLAGYRENEVSLVGGERPLRTRAVYATASLFDLLGVAPARGRVYTAEEDQDGGPAVAVLSHELWRSAFSGDGEIVGKQIEVDGMASTVLGVMPQGFDIEEKGAQIWLPVQLDRSNRENRGSHFLNVVARLRDGITLTQAHTEIESLVADWERRAGANHVPSADGHPLRLDELHETVVGESKAALYALLGAVGLVLLIACSNVANLLLAKGEGRQREMALRSMLGAQRSRLIRKLLVESTLLSLVGAALGVLVANLGIKALLAAFPGSIPRASEVALSPRVLLVTTAIAIATGVLFGLFPALQMSQSKFGVLLKEGGTRTSGSKASVHTRRGLVVAEIALAVVLVVGAGLMIRSLQSLLQADSGFSTERLSTFELYLPESGYPEAGQQLSFLERLSDNLRSVPGVEQVAAANGLPPLRAVNANDMEFEGVERSDDGPAHNIDFWQFITPEYLDTLDISLRSGRSFLASDDGAAPPVALINQKAAETFWPDQDPLGRRLRPGFGDPPWFTIVGIVEDVKQQGLASEVGTEVYWHHAQVGEALGRIPRSMNVVVRSQLAEDQIAGVLRDQVSALDGSLPVSNVRTLQEVVVQTLSQERLLTLLLMLFGGIALFLAAIGIYGVMSYSVAQRSQELGIRLAMGAERKTILALVLKQGLWLTALGVGVGVVAALGLSRFVQSLLFGISPQDPVTFVGVILVLIGVAVLAVLVPALRATRVDPMRVLRPD